MVDPIGTCQALDLLTQDQLEQLFDESNGYLSKVDEIFDSVQMLDIPQHHSSSNDLSNDEDDDDDDGGGGFSNTTNQIPKPKLRQRQSSIITDKKCLILDVDNTLIYVRHFMDEMRVGDTVKLGERDALVTKITYRLDLEFSDKPGQMTGYDHVLQSKEDSIPQRGEWFPDEHSKVAIIHQSDPTGCVIQLIDDTDDDDDDDSKEREDIEISFLQNSDELSQLEPMMNRTNYLSVTFMYGGYLVRIRPGLGQFLSLCNTKYDVILFTAADGSVYQGLLKQVHNILKQEMENDNDIDFDVPNKLWQQVYFRNDCDEKLDEYGLPYRHKNLAKLGRELSTIVMVDDNPLSYRGFEPNSVRVAGFWGLAQPADNELMQTLFPTLWTIADHKDVRYYLSGLGQPPQDGHTGVNGNDNDNDNPFDNVSTSDDDDDDLLSKQRRHSRRESAKFLQHLKEAIVAENESLEASSEDEQDEHDETQLNINGHDEERDDDDDGGSNSSIGIEATPGPPSSDTEDHASLDSMSGKEDVEMNGDAWSKKDRTYEHKELDEIFDNGESNIDNGQTFDDTLFKNTCDDGAVFEKRPSIELQLDLNENNARGTAHNSPHVNADDEDDCEEEDEDSKALAPVDSYNEEEDEEDEDVDDNSGKYVIAMEKGASGSISVSSNKRVDAQLLGDRDKTEFDDIGMNTTSPPSRTPTPLTDIEAEILIEKTTSCSCFGFFGKKKKKDRNIGLAQQELR